MNSSNLFVLGLLLLTANLSFAALFSPAHAGRADVDRLLLVVKLALLAAIQIGAWAIVLHQGGAAPTLIDAFTRSAACFTFVSGAKEVLNPPWGEAAAFISLNGLLFIPVTLLPWMRTSSRPLEEPLHSLPQREPGKAPPLDTSVCLDKTPQHNLTSKNHTPPEATQRSVPSSLKSNSSAATGRAQTPETTATQSSPEHQPAKEIERGGFRPKIPKALSPNTLLSPEQELAEQMKPVGPTPPPIRFEWKN